MLIQEQILREFRATVVDAVDKFKDLNEGSLLMLKMHRETPNIALINCAKTNESLAVKVGSDEGDNITCTTAWGNYKTEEAAPTPPETFDFSELDSLKLIKILEEKVSR